MSYQVQQSTTAYPLVFLMVQSSDHITGLTGASPTVTISKNGGAFASPSGAVTEIANGWYKVAGNATDSNTLGPLTLHATAASGDPTDVTYEVVVDDLTTSALRPTTAGRTLDVSAGGEAGLDWANIGSPTTTVALSGTSTKALEPTVASRTLDVTATGAAGIDWGNLENPTTANGLTGTSIATSQVVASVSGAVGSVTGAVGSVTGNVGGSVASVTAGVTVTTNNDKTDYTLSTSAGIKKNTALANFEFYMTDATTHTAKTGLTVTAERSIDGGAFSACANSVSEVGNGVYKISLAAGDLNGDTVTLRFTATGADDRIIGIVTGA